MMIPSVVVAVLAQAREETGDPSTSGWFAVVIALILVAFLTIAVVVRRARRRQGAPPAGSVPAQDLPMDR